MRNMFQSPQLGQPEMPPSLAPQIADLGTMIDQFAQRKIALAKMAEQERVNREKDLYYRGRVAAQEKRNEQMAANEQTRMDAAAMREARTAPGAGPVVLHRGGRARMFNPRFDPGTPSTAAPQAPGDIDSALSGFGRIPGMAPPAPQAGPDELTDLMNSASLPQGGEPVGLPQEGPEPGFNVTAVPPQRTQGEVYDARNPVQDDLEERSRRMYPRQQRDLVTANQAIERGESGLAPTPHNKEWADFYGRNASADPETTQREYEAKKAAERADAGAPDANVTAVPPTRVEGAVYRPGQPETMFFDDAEDDLVSALIGPDDQRSMELPRDAFPPGAREGDRFNREDVGEDGRKGNPFGGPVSRSPRIDYPGDRATVDEFDENESAILPDGLENAVTVPRDSLPPGAREGETYNTEDLGQGGRKGNPFAGPVPGPGSTERQPPPLQPGDLGGAQVTAVPQARTEGDIHDTRKQGPRWVYEAEGEEPFVIDEGQRQLAREYETRNRIATLERQFDQAVPGSMAQMLAGRELAMARAGLAGQDARQVRGFTQQTGEREGRQEAQASESAKAREFKAGESAADRASREKIAAMRKRKGGGASAATSSGPGSAFSKLAPKDQRWIDSAVNTKIGLFDREMNWNKLEGSGFDRLDLALENITAKGPRAGAAHMEAMMNFFGYIRGGVPAKNETDEFKSQTGTLWTWLERMGMKLGGKGWNPSAADKAAFTESLARMPEAQRRGLQEAIDQSYGVLLRVANKNISAQMEGFKTASVPMKERAQDAINAKMRFIGEKPRQWFAETPLIPDFVEQGTGASPPQSGATPGLDSALQELLKMKKGGAK